MPGRVRGLPALSSARVVPSAAVTVQNTGSVMVAPVSKRAVKVPVTDTGSGSTTTAMASVSSLALAAVVKVPPVSSAMHCICARASGSEPTSKPMTWAVKSMPACSSARMAAQGSGLQVSIPSETSTTVAFSSV